MIFAQAARRYSVALTCFAIGAATGWVGCGQVKPDAAIGIVPTATVEIEEPTTILPAAPAKSKNRATVNGIEVESDDPIVVDVYRSGPSQSNTASGTSTSAGLTTPNGDAAGNFNASAGTPSLPSLWGGPLAFTLPGGSALSFEFTSSMGMAGFTIVGGILIAGAGLLWYFTRNIVLALVVSGIGLVFISIGIAPQLWAWAVLVIGALAAVWLGIHIWRARGAKKSAEELTEYDELAASIRRTLTPEQTNQLKIDLPPNLRTLFDRLT